MRTNAQATPIISADIQPHIGGITDLSKNDNLGGFDPNAKVNEIISTTDYIQIVEDCRLKFNSGIHDYKEYKELLEKVDLINFRYYVCKYLFSEFPKVSETSTINSYKEISFYIFLLSLGFKSNFFEDGDFFSLNNFSELFDAYFVEILKSDNLEVGNIDSKESLSYMKSIATLCGVLNLICLLSQNDNLRRDFIDEACRFLNERINNLLKFLNKEESDNVKMSRNSLNFIKGLLSLNYSHIQYISLTNLSGNLNDLLGNIGDISTRYLDIVNNIIEGYNVSKSSDYGNDPNKRTEMIKYALLINLNYVISLFILKFDGKVPDSISLVDVPDFRKVIDTALYALYGDNIPSYSSLEDIKNISNNLALLCFSENFYSDTLDKKSIFFKSGLNILIEDFDDVDREYVKSVLSGETKIEALEEEKLYKFLLVNYRLTSEIFSRLLDKLPEVLKSNINYIQGILSGFINIDNKEKEKLSRFLVDNNNLPINLLSELSKKLPQGLSFNIDHVELLTKGISSGEIKIGNTNQLEILYNLLLFNNNLSSELLLKLGEKLLIDSSLNINYEVIKLKIFNLILTRIAGKDIGEGILLGFLENLTSYIDQNKVSSHLLFSYSLLYVSIGYCYSFFRDEKYHNLALDNYSRFRQINKTKFDFLRYGINIEKFYFNIGSYYINDDESELEEGDQSELSVGKIVKLEDRENLKKLLEISGKNQLRTSSNRFMEENINNVLGEFYTFISLHDEKKLILSEFSENLSKILGKMFHGIATIRIIDKSSSGEIPPIPNYNKVIDFELTNGYVFQLIYPNVFGEFFSEFNLISPNDDFKYLGNDGESKSGVIGKILKKLRNFLEKFREDNELNFDLVMDFNKAFEEGRIKTFAQGIFDKEGKLIKYEFLTRIVNPLKIGDRYANIQDYLTAARLLEEGKLPVRKLIDGLMKTAIDKIKEDPSIEISINAEYGNLIDEDYFIRQSESLGQTDFPVENITFELIEDKWYDSEIVIKNIKRLKAAGFKIAIDDFGIGDSTIGRLIELLKLEVMDKNGKNVRVLDFIKIDGKFVKGLLDPSESEANKITIKYIVEMSRAYGVHTIAEFISKEELFMMTKILGVDFFQGFYLGEPKEFK